MELMIYTNHESLKHLKGQGKLNNQHSKSVTFIESFSYVIRYEQGKDNIIGDAILQVCSDFYSKL